MSPVVVVVPDRGREPGILMAGPVLFAQQRGPGPGSTGADRLAIDAGHRHDPAGRGRDEHLGRRPAQVAGAQPALLDRLAGLPGQLQRRAPRNAGQHAASSATVNEFWHGTRLVRDAVELTGTRWR